MIQDPANLVCIFVWVEPSEEEGLSDMWAWACITVETHFEDFTKTIIWHRRHFITIVSLMIITIDLILLSLELMRTVKHIALEEAKREQRKLTKIIMD